MKTGIYKITSSTGKIYIGQSREIEKRMRKYKNSFCTDQPRLYKSISKYGWESHIFEIIEECEINQLNIRERYWQDFYNVIGENGLNCVLTETDVLPVVISEETRLKHSNSRKGLLVGDKNPMFGKNFTKEHRANISKSNIGKTKGKIISEKHKLILSKVHKNKIRTEKERNQQSETLKQQYKDGKTPHSCKMVINIENGVFYDSILQASKTFPIIKYTTLRAMLSEQNPNLSPFIFC